MDSGCVPVRHRAGIHSLASRTHPVLPRAGDRRRRDFIAPAPHRAPLRERRRPTGRDDYGHDERQPTGMVGSAGIGASQRRLPRRPPPSPAGKPDGAARVTLVVQEPAPRRVSLTKTHRESASVCSRNDTVGLLVPPTVYVPDHADSERTHHPSCQLRNLQSATLCALRFTLSARD